MKIAQLGTFDVENYGDLLFPALAVQGLRRQIRDLAIQPVSPVGGEPVWADSPSCLGYEQFSREASSYNGILVGGGNIIRATPTDLDRYNTDLVPLLGYANLWLAPVADNTIQPLPVCWNAPGVPGALPGSLQALLHRALERVDYISVRDELSRQYLTEVAPNLEIAVVPDSAWEIDRLWTQELLSDEYTNAFVSRKAEVPSRSIVFHINSRYFNGAKIDQIAQGMDQLCRALEAKAILIALGPCHGDSSLALSIAAHTKTDPLVIYSPRSLKEVTACIASSIAYVGSSMHGFVVASAFCVPATVVASRRMVKFPGLLSQIGLPNLLHESWHGAFENITTLVATDHAALLRQVRATQHLQLQKHWAKIADIFSTAPKSAARKAMLSPHAITDYRASVLGMTAMAALNEKKSAMKKLEILGARETTLNVNLKAREAEVAKLTARLTATECEVSRLTEELKQRGREVEELPGVRLKREEKTVRIEALSMDVPTYKRAAFELQTWRITALLRRIASRLRRLVPQRLRHRTTKR